MRAFTRTERKILSALSTEGWLTTKDVASKVGMKLESTMDRLDKMNDNGAVLRRVSTVGALHFEWSTSVRKTEADDENATDALMEGSYEKLPDGYLRASGEKMKRVSLYLPESEAKQLKFDAYVRGFSGPAAYVSHLAALSRDADAPAPALPAAR